MLLYEVMSDDFVLVPQDAAIVRVKAFTAALRPGCVIFQSGKQYWLLHADEVESPPGRGG